MEEKKKGIVKDQQFLLGLFGGIAAVSVIGLIVLAVAFFASSRGKVAGTVEQNQNTNVNQPVNQEPQTPAGLETEAVTVEGVKTFLAKKGATICQEDGKPVVYLFTTTWCPHCEWISDTFDATVKKYVDEGKIRAYHWELDTNDNTLTTEKETQVPTEQMAVYQEFNPQGSIPTFVFGCKYFRVGNGYEQQDDLAAEQAEFEALIKDLTK